MAIVVYVGNESKIMKNAKKAPKKVSNLMVKMNYMLYSVFGFQFTLICVYASLCMWWDHSTGASQPQLSIKSKITFKTWFLQLLTFWVAYSHLIPISLYVIIEMLKLTQAYLIG